MSSLVRSYGMGVGEIRYRASLPAKPPDLRASYSLSTTQLSCSDHCSGRCLCSQGWRHRPCLAGIGSMSIGLFSAVQRARGFQR